MQKVKSRLMLSFMVALVFLAERGVAQENFYAGKTIRVIVGYAPATTTDQWARIFARHAANSWKSDAAGAKCSGCELDDRRQSGLFRR